MPVVIGGRVEIDVVGEMVLAEDGIGDAVLLVVGDTSAIHPANKITSSAKDIRLSDNFFMLISPVVYPAGLFAYVYEKA